MTNVIRQIGMIAVAAELNILPCLVLSEPLTWRRAGIRKALLRNPNKVRECTHRKDPGRTAEYVV